MSKLLSITSSLLMLLALTGCGNGSTKNKALESCSDKMKSDLISPSTAAFASLEESAVFVVKEEKLKAGKIRYKYIINSHVDSQNRFGAMIRTKFTCKVSGNNRGFWYVDSIHTVG